MVCLVMNKKSPVAVISGEGGGVERACAFGSQLYEIVQL